MKWGEKSNRMWLCFLCLTCCVDLLQATKQPNIVFILSDDQGFADVSWQSEELLTPNLEELRNRGVLLNYNYVQPICTPTRSSLMTGYYPYHLGRQRGVLGLTTPTGLQINRTLLPERLRDLGYSTHAIGKWHLGYCDWKYTPTNRGFDTHYGYYQAAGDYFTHEIGGGYDFRDNEFVDWNATGTYSANLFGDRAVEIIEEEAAKDGPFFLYLALQSVHTPFQVPDKYLDYYPESNNRVYLAMVTAMDDVVGQVMKALRSTDQEKDTILVFSSDNGSQMPAMNKPLRGNKATLWEGGTRVPGIVYSPLLQNTPREYSGLFHVTDWYNTLLTAAGADTLPINDGFNQWQALSTGDVSSPRDTIIYNLDVEDDGEAHGAIRVGKYKLYIRTNTIGDKEFLADLDDDPYETTNLLEERPDVANELRELLLAQVETLVPHDTPDGEDAGNSDNWDGVWTPGWCTAH